MQLPINNINTLQEIATQVRRDIVRQVHGCQSGHPGGSLGCADVVVALYFHIMQHNALFSMEGKEEDMFYLSNGHISPLLYSVLARSGYFPVQELSTFRKLNSRLQGHPTTHEHLPGIRMSAGSLGQGLSVAIGAALSKKLLQENKRVFVLMGDGEQNEGQVWEAVQFAAHHKVDNLIAIVDVNGQQIDGPTEKVMSNRSLAEKYKAFGWQVIEEPNGNNMQAVVNALQAAITATNKQQPIVIMLHTEMGAGVDFMMGSHKWHGVAPNNEQLQAALAQLPETLGDY